MDAGSNGVRSEELWRYVPISDYSVPAVPAADQVGGTAARLWERFKGIPVVREHLIGRASHLLGKLGGGSGEESAMVQDRLNVLPHQFLERVAPEPDWSGAARAMDSMLEEWLSQNGTRPGSWLRVIVGAPFSGTRETLRHLASERKWPIIEPPSTDEILNGGNDWLSRLVGTEGSPVVIPQLEKCYLRHYNGLSLIRKLVDILLSGNTSCIIGCNSWAWAYLSNALSLGTLFPVPYTLEAFDGMRLQRWFAQLASKEGDLTFRQSDDGSIVIPRSCRVEEESEVCGEKCSKEGDPGEACSLLKRLAAHSRGIPGVARALWRHSLRTASEREAQEKARDKAAEDDGKTIWVEPWARLDLPSMPDERDRSQLFVVHAVLLHHSLEPRLLRQLLSMSKTDALATLHHLRQAGILDANMEEGSWRIAPLGYPTIRRVLERAGYMLDAV